GGDLSAVSASTGGGVDGTDLTLVGVTVTENAAKQGGGVGAQDLTLQDSVIEGNSAAVGGGVGMTGGHQVLESGRSSIIGHIAGPAPGIHTPFAADITLTTTTLGNSTASVQSNLGSEVNALGKLTLVHATIIGTANAPAIRATTVLTSFASVIDRGAGPD